MTTRARHHYGPPPKLTAMQRAFAEQYANDLPPPGTPSGKCPACGCTYADYHAGRAAHDIVFGHWPTTEQEAE